MARVGPPSDLGDLYGYVRMKKSAVEDVKYWGGDPKPWRNGTTDEPITDEMVIERETKRKVTVELEDNDNKENAHSLRNRGISVKFLLQLTHELNIWEWETWEVVQFLVKPATEERRCRFADLDYIKPHTGPATVFMSHCWSGKWGDVVSSSCSGARDDRIVWIDIFAVRQWPGNVADLNFRGVIANCTALIVAFAPVPVPEITGTLAIATYLKSPEYAMASKLLPFLRLWCIGKLLLKYYIR